MGIAAIDLFDGQRWWPLNTRSPFRLRWFLGKSFVGSRIIFVSIEDERWFFYFGTISGNYTCHIFISSTSVLDLGRVCILLFFPLIFWCSNISQALKFWCFFSSKIRVILLLSKCCLIYWTGCLFPAKELRIDQSSDLLLLVGLFCEVLASCKNLTM